MSLLELQKSLEKEAKRKYHFKINDNRSTMLSVKWEPDSTKVSLHKMFLEAPRNIMEELACYLKRERGIISPKIRAFIETNIKKLDYSHEIDPKKLCVHGNTYNLDHIFDKINHFYFKNELDLHITWFGRPGQKNRSRVTFGLYHDQLKLIKINRLMDTPSFPEYVVDFVVYHEMLHHVCPSYYDKKGHHQIHSKEFKEKEQDFKYFSLATEWLKKNQNNFFTYF